MAVRAPLLLLCMFLFAAVASASSAEETLDRCMQRCQRRLSRSPEQLRSCHRMCREVAEGNDRGRRWEGSEGESERTYFFEEDSFSYVTRTEHGHCKVLENFRERSGLLRGIENYRVGILEANPQSFVLPHHFDADAVAYVANGRGVVTIIIGDNKDTHEIRAGDIFRIPMGASIYAANTDRSQNIRIVTIFNTISTPGEFREYFGVGGQDPESFYNSFSSEIMEAALNVSKDEWQSLFRKQRSGAIVRASEEQIRALEESSSKSGTKGVWPFGSKSSWSKPYNLLEQKPAHSNDYGQYYEVTRKDYEDLGDLDMEVCVANLSSGSVMGPIYNTEATTIAVVLSGCGNVEIVCPHMAEHQSQSRSRHGSSGGHTSKVHYRRSRSEVCEGTAFVVPAGHPQAVVSSSDSNFAVLCFCVNAGNNRKQFLAGENNVVSLMDNEALELSFDEEAEKVKEVFSAQDESLFFPGTRSWKGGRGRGGSGRRERLADILEVAGL